MNPIYKFEITATHGSQVDVRTVKPFYKSDLAVDWELESGERYYRGKLSGKLTFVAGDYDWIVAKDFESEYELRIFISYNDGTSWAQYWTGRFWQTDCEYDADNKQLTVSPAVYDGYNDVVAGLEKSFDLVALAPQIEHILIDKRPLIQIYAAGEEVVSCFLSGMSWEQECTAVSSESELVNTYKFVRCRSNRIITISGSEIDDINGLWFGDVPATRNYLTAFQATKGNYTFKYWHTTETILGVQYDVCHYQIVNANNVALYQSDYTFMQPDSQYLNPGTIDAIAPQTQNIHVDGIIDKILYGRYLMDVEYFSGQQTSLLPANDLVPNNRNYTRCIGYAFDNTIYFNDQFSATPTKYGLYKEGQYYTPPADMVGREYYPIAKTTWGAISVWFTFWQFDAILEKKARKQYTLNDAYPIAGVISALLGQIAPDVKHEATTAYSSFLYGAVNPITYDAFKLFIAQKSNILAGNYEQPAQQAPTTLQSVLDMLRKCFRLYWFIDKNGSGEYMFRIEHIKWFMNGGSYSGSPVVGVDLTSVIETRNGKPWAFDTSKFSFDKLEMPERYEFAWMDEVTKYFAGNDINIESRYVSAGNVENVTVADYTSDVDYMITNPGGCDSDGFALLAANLDTDSLLEIGENNGYIASPSGALTIQSAITNTFHYYRVYAGRRIRVRANIIGNTSTRAFLAFWAGTAPATNGSRLTVIKAFAGLESYDAYYTPEADGYIYIQTLLGGTAQASNITLVNANNDYKLPYVNFADGANDHILQNAYAAFYYLQQFYMDDMPAYDIEADFYNFTGAAEGIKKQKTQSVNFPAYNDVNLLQLVKTNIGNGQIEKLSINLSSRTAKATLKYATK